MPKIMVWDVDAAWAAGFVDGEGNIRFQRDKRGYGRLVIDVAQARRKPLDKLKQMFGGKVYGPYKPKTKNSSAYYRWTLIGPKVKKAISYMIFYFQIKTTQSLEALRQYHAYQKEPERKRGPKTSHPHLGSRNN